MSHAGSAHWPVPWVFDCDGVLLDSNAVKTEAFRVACAPYGDNVAEAVVAHHITHGGLSRYAKFERLFTDVLQRPAEAGELESLLERFGKLTRQGLATSPTDPAAAGLLERIRAAGSSTYVASGGDRDEVRWALDRVGLARWFDEIHGSPRAKGEIVASILDRCGDPRDMALVGDSRIDMEIALEHGMGAVFVSHWSEFAGWESFVEEHGILAVDDLSELHQRLRETPRDDAGRLADWLRSMR